MIKSKMANSAVQIPPLTVSIISRKISLSDLSGE